MKVGVTVWEDRISPVFDAARMLLVAEVESGSLVSREFMPCRPERIGEFVQLLRSKGVGEVICGAISQEPAGLLEANEIHLIAFIAGRVDTVLGSYVEGKSISEYRMPGCCGNNRCGRIDWYRNGAPKGVGCGGLKQRDEWKW